MAREELGIGVDGAAVFDEEQDAGGLGIEAMEEAEEAEVPFLGPGWAVEEFVFEGGLEVVGAGAARGGGECPAGGFIDRDERAVFEEDWNGGEVGALAEGEGGGGVRRMGSAARAR